jgi:hypothetical protein
MDRQQVSSVRHVHIVLIVVVSTLMVACGGGTPAPTEVPPTNAVATPTPVYSNGTLTPNAPIDTPAPQSTLAATSAATPAASALGQIDQVLTQTMAGHLAYNLPATMQLDEKTTIQLVMSPSLSPHDIGTQITEAGVVTTAEVIITPRMRAELISADPGAFVIQALHADAEQLMSASEPTEWRWTVTAKKDGQQILTLTVYRLVQYNGKDYWREISYEHNIQVQVTPWQRLQQLNWEWIVGIIATGILVPAIWRWVDQRQKKPSRRKR